MHILQNFSMSPFKIFSKFRVFLIRILSNVINFLPGQGFLILLRPSLCNRRSLGNSLSLETPPLPELRFKIYPGKPRERNIELLYKKFASPYLSPKSPQAVSGKFQNLTLRYSLLWGTLPIPSVNPRFENYISYQFLRNLQIFSSSALLMQNLCKYLSE